MMRRSLVALVAALLLPFAAAAQETRQVVVPFEDAAKIAISGGDLDGAEKLLMEALRLNPKSTDALFLMAEVERRRGRLKEAAEYYRKILVDRPELGRVRLELARALFDLGEDFQSEYHFRLALAQPDLPEAVVQNISAFLNTIRRRKQYSFSLDFGVSPDTNVTTGPSKNEVLLFGSPAQLSDQAREKSGVGFTVSGNAEYLAKLTDEADHRWRIGTNLYRAEYPGDEIDDMQLRLYTGPQLRYDRLDISVLGVFAKRWFGPGPYNEGIGGRVEAGYLVAPQWRVDGFFEVLHLDYRVSKFLDGESYNSVLFTTYGIDQQSYVRLITGGGTERTATPGFSNYSLRIGIGYLRNLPWGITASIQPEFYYVPYDSRLAAFNNIKRLDRIYTVLVSAYKRDWNFWGFSPTLNYSFTRDESNIDLFTFTRHRFNIGLTREF